MEDVCKGGGGKKRRKRRRRRRRARNRNVDTEEQTKTSEEVDNKTEEELEEEKARHRRRRRRRRARSRARSRRRRRRRGRSRAPNRGRSRRRTRRGRRLYSTKELRILVHDAIVESLGDKEKALTHSSRLADSEPQWGSYNRNNRTKLPRNAFANRGVSGQKSTWGFPHHWVQNGGNLNDDGIFTTGDMFLHRGGLIAALQAAAGARSGQEASSSIKGHLNRHARSVGLKSIEMLILEKKIRKAIKECFDK